MDSPGRALTGRAAGRGDRRGPRGVVARGCSSGSRGCCESRTLVFSRFMAARVGGRGAGGWSGPGCGVSRHVRRRGREACGGAFGVVVVVVA